MASILSLALSDMPAPLDLVGDSYHRLTVLRKLKKRTAEGVVWLCRCDCGRLVKVCTSKLRSGNTKSCGCLQRDIARSTGHANKTHGCSHAPEYQVWRSMFRRCYETDNSSYATYGGRGIKVCKRWGDFSKFYQDMGPRPTPNHSIDRKKTNGNYTPSNCRWATLQEQNDNRRSNLPVTIKGVEYPSMASAGRAFGIGRSCMYNRYRRGMRGDDLIK